jgi:glycosyltransferase involved in cell wall biosynthesis
MRIAIVFGNDGTDPRIIRTCRTLVKLGHEVHFIGWDRRAEPPRIPNLGGAERHVLRCAMNLSRSTMWAQLRFSWFVARQLAKLRPDIVCAANEENAVRCLPFRKLLYRRLVCDVIDSQRDVFSARALPVRLGWSAIAELAHIGADTLIATDHTRFQYFGRHQYKTKVIGNFPEDPGDASSANIPTGDIKLYVAGVLTESRGLGQLMSAIDGMNNIRITAAGWPTDKLSSETFVNHPKVDYQGFVHLEQSLELASRCDAVLGFYAPNCRNNILASPTKLYEAMSVGRPLIINTEAQVSKWVVENSLGYSCNYEDVAGLRRILESLVTLRRNLPQFAKHARQTFRQNYCWERMEDTLVEIYGRENVSTAKGIRREAA